MKRRIKYNRVIFVTVFIIFICGLIMYMFSNRRNVHEYNGTIQTYQASYKQGEKVYTFDLKAFLKDNIHYVSLNDMYNMMVITDPDAKVYIDYNQQTMTYQLSDKTYLFDYGHNKIVYNNNCIELDEKKDKIYVSHKNVYISVFLTEKIILNNKKTVTFENKTAIIQ